jgi:hypothetical protein
MRLVAGILSCALVLIILVDAFETIILPRRVRRRIRLTTLFYRSTWRPWSAIARRIGKARRRETYLSYYGPFSTLLLLTVWAAGMIVAFAGIHWSLQTPLQAPERYPDFWTYLYMSGSNYFTLGLGDVTVRSGIGRFLSVLEGGMGFGFLAIVIGYFPVLYQAFSSREVSIVLMDARAGSPPSALEFLRNLAETRGLDSLDSGLHEMEHWTAELLESHISYAVLCYFRSQHDNQSWLGAITAVLDTCALIMTGIDGISPRQAQLTFAISRHAVVDIAQILKRPPVPPQFPRLPPGDFERLREQLAGAGLRLHDGPEAMERLAVLRSRYEPYVSALSRYLAMRLPPWVSERRSIHNWETSAWGRVTAHAPVASSEPIEDDHA